MMQPLRLAELDKAAQTYQQEVESYPRDYRTHVDLGNVYNEQGQYEKGSVAYRQSLRVADSGSAYAGLVNSLWVIVLTEGNLKFTDQHGKVQEVYAKAGESRWFPTFRHK